MITRISIDPNVRVRDNQTFVGFRHVTGVVYPGLEVEVREDETGALGRGVVTEVDTTRRLVYLAVDWSCLRVPSHAMFQPTHQTEMQVEVQTDRALTFAA